MAKRFSLTLFNGVSVFQKLGKSQREKDTKNIASVAVYNKDGLLLFGKRGDNKKWCMPGGHFEPGEWPSQAADRELWEETGLCPVELEFIGDADVPRAKVHVFSFKATVGEQEPDNTYDPDQEFTEFRWVEPHNIPEEISNKFHNKQDVTLQCLGLQEKTFKSEGLTWRCIDGLTIPSKDNSKRLIWDEKYRDLAIETFVKNDERVLDCYVDVHQVKGYNTAVNKPRLKLYKRMLNAGESLPPVLLRYDADGLNLLDGNHRQEAAIQTGIKYIKALVVWDDSNLEKAIGGIGAMMASGMLMGGALNTPNVPAPTAHSVEAGTGIKTWTPEHLHEDLYPIAHLESSWGKNTNHKPNTAGDYHTAFGALGFKPSTAHEEYKKSPMMSKNFPGLNDPAIFLKTFKTDPKFYNLLASAHFARLKARHGDELHAAYAWRHGSGAAAKAPEDVQANDPYIIQYKAMKSK